VSGQVFAVFGGRVHVLEGWTPAGVVEKDGRWTVAELEERAGELFGGRDPGVPPFPIGA